MSDMELNKRRNTDVNIQVVIDRLTNLHDDVNDLKESTRDSMKEIANAITKLVLLEERQSHTNDNFSRVVNQLDNIQRRVEELEKQEPLQKLTSKWILTAVWSAAAAAVYFVAKFTGLA
jgi:thiamine kinase-like enzyme